MVLLCNKKSAQQIRHQINLTVGRLDLCDATLSIIAIRSTLQASGPWPEAEQPWSIPANGGACHAIPQ